MSYLVVAYPTITQADFNFIQSYRKQNDLRYFSVIEPHFTLVFPVDGISQDDFLGEVKAKVTNIQSFDFVANVATINQDDSGDYYHEFLVPDTGYSHIVKLHDVLYSGLFSPYLRFDIDFIPHIGIGNSDDVRTAKQRVDALNVSSISIAGRVEDITAIEYSDGSVRTIETIVLQ